MPHPLRLAVVSTPRAGNTWVRHLLGTAYQIPHIARHALAAAEWSALPPEVVLQIHWRHEPAFAVQLEEWGFRVVTVARHPLDVLISILHFCIYESESEHWLQGAGGSEVDIYAANPRSRTFIEYAKGTRARELLAVSLDWWNQPDVLRIRYEDCVRDTGAEMQRLETAFGPFRVPRSDVIVACAMERLRPAAVNNHFWKGSPGLWRHLLPAAEANEIAAAHQDVFARFGYDCTPDPALSALDADRNWVRLVGEEIKQTLQRSTDGHRAQLREKAERIAELERHCDDLTRRLHESVTLSGPVAKSAKRLWNRNGPVTRLIRRVTGRPPAPE